MKTLIPILLIACAVPVFADDPDDAAMAVFKSVQSAWSSGSHEKIGANFDKDSKVSLSLDDSGSYSKDQAIARLEKYFKSNKTTSLKPVEKDAYDGGNNPSASYDYEYTDSGGNKRKAKLLVTLKKKDGRWIVDEISRM